MLGQAKGEDPKKLSFLAIFINQKVKSAIFLAKKLRQKYIGIGNNLVWF